MTLPHPFEPIALAAALAVVGVAVAVPARGDAQPPALRAKAFDIAQVRLLDGPFHEARARDETYLLSLDTDRPLSGFRSEAGPRARQAVHPPLRDRPARRGQG